jgi:hypothetical protein
MRSRAAIFLCDRTGRAAEPWAEAGFHRPGRRPRHDLSRLCASRVRSQRGAMPSSRLTPREIEMTSKTTTNGMGRCPRCYGTGDVPFAEPGSHRRWECCPVCDGAGEVGEDHAAVLENADR